MISKKDYFFYEWLIVERKITEEKFEQLTPPEMEALKVEYSEFVKRCGGQSKKGGYINE